MNPYILAARFKTLPLAVSGIISGTAVAGLYGQIKIPVFIFGSVTALLLQVLSNYANDLGDFQKGTDTMSNRDDRMMASGKLTYVQMRRAIILTGVLAFISGLILLFQGIEKINSDFFIFLGMGIASIIAAIAYTMGKKAYGYFGFGDLFVFVFFGLMSVAGIFYLHTGSLQSEALLAAMGMGFLSTAVLNVNNIRDMETDLKAGKKTLALQLGNRGSFLYHRVLVWGGFVFTALSFLLFLKGHAEIKQMEYLMLTAAFTPFLALFGFHINALHNAAEKSQFNKQLKNLSLTILGFVLFYALLVFFYTAL